MVIDALEVAQQVEPSQEALDGYDNDPLNDTETLVMRLTMISLNSCQSPFFRPSVTCLVIARKSGAICITIVISSL